MKKTKKEELTKNEKRLWDYLTRYMMRRGESPLRIEIAEAMSMSPQLAQYRLRKLEKKGWVKLMPLEKRNIMLK